MGIELVIALGALAISLLSLRESGAMARQLREDSALTVNLTNLLPVEGQIGTTPDLLRFHGIEDPPGALKKHGISAEEFSYLVASFALGGIYFRTSSHGERVIQEGGYRYRMCEAHGTRRAWPLVRRVFEPGPFIEAIDDLMESFEKRGPLPKLKDVAEDTLALTDDI